MIIFKVIDDQKLIDYSKLFIENKLYENDDWMMKRKLDMIISNRIKNTSKIKVVAAFCDDRPIGLCLYHIHCISTYVLPEYRNQKIGQSLFLKTKDLLSEYLKKKVVVGSGSEESHFFFQSLINQKIISQRSLIDH